MTLDKKILERIIKPIESDRCITQGTTPVIYFGNYEKAKACTVSLNPSHWEFLDNTGNILNGAEERLCSRQKLNKNDNDILSNEDAKKILNYCNNYFINNPYKYWFDPFNTFINRFGNYSYYSDTCVHLDLVQWATTPVWGKITDQGIRDYHLDNDFPVLEHLLQKDFEIMFLNGTTVVKNIIQRLNININTKTIPFNFGNGNGIPLTISYGKYNNTKIIGWNLYLQYTVSTEADINSFCDIIKQNL